MNDGSGHASNSNDLISAIKNTPLLKPEKKTYKFEFNFNGDKECIEDEFYSCSEINKKICEAKANSGFLQLNDELYKVDYLVKVTEKFSYDLSSIIKIELQNK